ncbi:XRE family transcriptional regulator (plasmid) [Embleya sp. NBC_00888]|uniref:helix-turn-helix domain-containing protein n=1 Tax=Embleya sp. NBC_00888 TaxID=2975960 RepID=UPI002F9134A4|nr:XRE family transcriptional regulator [Embleya sp. NBC_00888]
MDSMPAIAATLGRIGPRLRRLREKRNLSLTRLGDITGISKSTLSRLESGQRKPSLELLLPIAAALAVSLDDIVAAPRVVAPRVVPKPRGSNGRIFVSLSRQQAGEPRAFRVTIPRDETEAVMRTHTGYAWLYVLSGRLRLILDERDVILGPGEVAEFDTRHPHWFGSSGHGDVEVLSLFGKQGERIRVRVQGRPPTA